MCILHLLHRQNPFVTIYEENDPFDMMTLAANVGVSE